ncbi:C-X-C motif chemokine 11-6-like [Anguilla rostrata]|uniref:C-X-C motif chemokine 11-6-like n=1 Tax=Anguilla rostrata TaxID=7938 RepID=UPI0030D48587
MRSAAFILLACLLFVDVKGMSQSPKGRCYCMDAGVKFILPRLIEKIEVYYPSSSCENMELVATLKGSGEQKCLNPKSQFARNFIKNAQRQKSSTADGSLLRSSS